MEQVRGGFTIQTLARLSVLIGLFVTSGCASDSSVKDAVAEAFERPSTVQVGRARDEGLMEFEARLWAPFRNMLVAIEGMLARGENSTALEMCNNTLKILETHYKDCGKDCSTLATGGYSYEGYWPNYQKLLYTFTEQRIKALIGLNRNDEAYVALTSSQSPSPFQILVLGHMALDRGEYTTAMHAYGWLEDYRLRIGSATSGVVESMSSELLRKLAPDSKRVTDRIPQDGSVPVRHCLQAVVHTHNSQLTAALAEANSCVEKLSSNPLTLAAANSFAPGRPATIGSTWTDSVEMGRLTLERAHRERGKLLVALGRFDEAVIDLSRPGVQHLTLPNSQTDTREKEPISQYMLALAREGKGEYGMARQLLLNMDGSVGRMQWGVNNGSQLELARWIALARVSLHLGPQGGALPGDPVKFIDRALQLAPKDTEVLFGAIRAYHAAGNVSRAKEHLSELRRINPARASQLEGIF